MPIFGDLKANVTQNAAAKITDTESGSFVKQAVSQIWQSHEWSVKKGEQAVATVADYTTGTVTVTQGSATIVGAGTTWTSSMVARWFRIGSYNDLYKITGFTDATHLTIENPTGGTGYQGATASAQSYTILQHVYEMSSDTDVITFPSRQYPITKTRREAIDAIDPYRNSTSTFPSLWAPRELSSNNYFQIELWPRISTAGVVRVPYLKKPPTLVNTSDEALLRADVIEHLASHKALVYLASKFDPGKYLPIAKFFWTLFNGEPNDPNSGSLSQAIRQDLEKYGMISHVGAPVTVGGYDDNYLATHDVTTWPGGWD